MKQEERLTLTGEDLYWKDEECWLDAERPDSYKIDQVYYKLAEYEDAGLSPAEVEELKHRAEVAEDCIRIVIGVLRYEFAGKTMIKMACEKTIESYGSIAKVIEKTDIEENDLIEYFTERLKERNNDRD